MDLNQKKLLKDVQSQLKAMYEARDTIDGEEVHLRTLIALSALKSLKETLTQEI